MYVLLEDKQKSKSGGVDRPWILPILAVVYIGFQSLLYVLGPFLELPVQVLA